MSNSAIRRIVIVGGGTAGWMTAAPLAQRFEKAGAGRCEIVLVESPDIGSIGVGEATLPPIRAYNRTLGLDDADFVRRTQGSFKLGIEFRDWGRLGRRFFHGFGDFGPAIDNRSPWQHWLRLSRIVDGLPGYEDWSMATVMALRNRFTPPVDGAPSAANAYSFAYHFDAGLYAAYLREYALARGAQRVEGTIVDVELRPEDGFVAAVRLADGRRVDGDLFIDCSGFRALLIAGAMQSPFEDWSALLPCNSALAVPSERVAPLTPYTMSTAKPAGWQWRIPLQHRTGNGHVYCSGFIGDDEAAATLLAGLDSRALDTPRQLRFTTGRRRQGWVKNVVAIGLSGGFLEPLESTSIQLIMDGVGRLIQLFPDKRFKPHLAAEFNRRMAGQYESIRDFIVLHYKLTERRDSELWRYCAAMPIPDSLAHQIELFRGAARVAIFDPEGFAEPSWVSLFLGLGLQPESHDPFVDHIDAKALLQHFTRLRQAIAQTAAGVPDHGDYIERHVKAPPQP
ncbi:tryptophan halogenase family protein [Roseateles saccharophilus]|uniref:Tryptophan halogenase n=1 Tax=Roseateles saccharophilus TaxID=304 RepID=A0A4R3UZJ7_ROSSA|nr:tryptophan halogenase family protein [Roseateles saccharophilus]MDG0833040.1 tryptophan 7-halogenase [Roseateles saccharophilus]TCU96238.1 tryptophan halogenase [Roseateles saccharophilus]